MSLTQFHPPTGTIPDLAWCNPGELQVDPTYQRGMEETKSRELISRIARKWNWDLCQPLIVARRRNGALFVIDGQHRLAAARMRGDIPELPCVVVAYASVADEAAGFVAINQERKPLTKLDLFRAAVASGNARAVAISRAMSEAGLSVAPHCNYISWKPGMVQHIGGIERAWERHGEVVTKLALSAQGQAFAGQIQRYGGTLFRGIVRVCVDEARDAGGFAAERFDRFVAMLAARDQDKWVKAEQRFFAEGDVLFRGQAIEELMRREWRVWLSPGRTLDAPRIDSSPARGEPVLTQKGQGFGLGANDFSGDTEWTWCRQCDARRTKDQALACRSAFCSLRGGAHG